MILILFFVHVSATSYGYEYDNYFGNYETKHDYGTDNNYGAEYDIYAAYEAWKILNNITSDYMQPFYATASYEYR